MENELTPEPPSEKGETLLEVLLAVLIIAVTMTALLGTLITSIVSSSEHRSLANLDTVLKNAAESAKYQVQLQPSAPWFGDCASVTSTTYTSPNGPTTNTFSFSVPSGYTVSVSSIQYWDSATNSFDDPSVSTSSCLSNPDDQTGFQLLTIVGVAPNGVTQSLSFAVRSPT